MMATPRLTTFIRPEFLAERFRFRAGEHWTIIGPTGCGKTWLAWQIMERITSPEHPGVVLLKKPRDDTTDSNAKRLHYRRERTWPPALWSGRPPGYVLQPVTKYDPDIDRPHKAAEFRRALVDAYRRDKRRYPQGVTIYADDAYGLSEILGLRQVLTELWTEARSSNCALGAGFQKPSHVPTWAYSMAEHVFLFSDPDKRNRDRFAEIGGIDPDVVKDTVMNLPEYHALYIRRGGRVACIVGAE